MKNKTFFDSIKCALWGIGYAFRTEKNFFYYVFIGTAFLIINIIIGVGMTCHIVYAAVCMGVFATEMINTSIEHMANALTKDIRKQIKVIKDMAAGGVLMWGGAFFIMEAVIIADALCNYFG